MSSISFKSVYDHPSVPGEGLVKPFKKYRNFFLAKEGAAWKLAHCISGLVAYPVLGALALIGIFFKWMGILEISRSQRVLQVAVDKYYPGLKVQPLPEKLGAFVVIPLK